MLSKIIPFVGYKGQAKNGNSYMCRNAPLLDVRFVLPLSVIPTLYME